MEKCNVKEKNVASKIKLQQIHIKNGFTLKLLNNLFPFKTANMTQNTDRNIGSARAIRWQVVKSMVRWRLKPIQSII